MTDDIPLQFAKEILHWPEAYRKFNGHASYDRIYAHEKGAHFSIYDIRKLLKLTQWYCNKVGTRIDLNCLYGEKPAEALMKACLELKKTLETR